MQKTVTNIPKPAAFLLLASLYLVAPSAHAGLMSEVAGLLANLNKETDESFGMLRSVLGDFVLDPFAKTDAGPGSLLAAMFKNFNMFVFSAACLWMGYNMLAGLAQTMHEGVVLGKRMSTVWMPVRIAFGTASLMPIFGGWAFAQALMVMATLLGISGANSLVKTAIDSTAAFNATVNPMGSVKQAAQLANMETFLLQTAACAQGAKDMDLAEGVQRDYPVKVDEFGSDLVVSFAGRSVSGMVGSTACGRLMLSFSPREKNSLMSAFGFRLGDVDYDLIKKASMKAHQAAITAVYKNSEIVARGASPRAQPDQVEAATSILKTGYFGQYSSEFQKQLAAVTATTQGVNNGAIQDGLKQRMAAGGWATLGTWYSTFAEVNEAMNEMLDPVVKTNNGPMYRGEMQSTYEDVYNGLQGLMVKAGAERNSSAPTEQGAMQTATGNFSIGQAIFGASLDMITNANSTGYSDTVNPIIAYKNLGDNALATAQVMYVSLKVAENFLGDGKGEQSVASDLAQKAVNLTPAGRVLSVVKGILADAAGMLMPVLMLMFVTAAVMAFYIPMVPFIQWFAALIQWFTSVIESLIGSTLWAMAHFDSDGEGMGQRTSYGYVYLLNNFARPIIMTFAFFVASAAITVMGTFLFRYFGQAVAGAQGNSMTGLMSIVAYMVILTVMGLTLINSTFSVMLNLPDRMIGWIGGNSSSALGHDVEQKIAGVFINAARGVPSSIGDAARNKAKRMGPGPGPAPQAMMREPE